MPIDKAAFRHALGHFAAGVTVVTTRGADGQPYGLTATAFSSLSLVPPLVLVCIDKKSESFPRFEESDCFAVNFLALGSRDVSQRFATSGGDKFSGIAHRTAATGAPVLEEALGFVDCRTVQRHQGCDHVIYVGEVEATEVTDAEPLLHFHGAYRKLADD
jgi:flavin reductase (DIM6/NTAB) family NADH-FMN oxidoreductase RutF